jgi:hypothetical protein
VGGRKVEGSIVNSVMGVLLLEDGDKDSYNGIQEFLLGRIRWFPAGDAVSYSAAGLAVGFGPPEVLNCGFLCDVKASHRRREFRRSFPCPTWCGGIGLVGGTWREGQTCQRGVCLVDAELPMTRAAGARRAGGAPPAWGGKPRPRAWSNHMQLLRATFWHVGGGVLPGFEVV